jgi:hypothetical protein
MFFRRIRQICWPYFLLSRMNTSYLNLNITFLAEDVNVKNSPKIIFLSFTLRFLVYKALKQTRQ